MTALYRILGLDWSQTICWLGCYTFRIFVPSAFKKASNTRHHTLEVVYLRLILMRKFMLQIHLAFSLVESFKHEILFTMHTWHVHLAPSFRDISSNNSSFFIRTFSKMHVNY